MRTSNLQTERVQLVKKQELLSKDLELCDLHMQFNNALGLPLATAVTLGPSVTDAPDGCEREACITVAFE